MKYVNFTLKEMTPEQMKMKPIKPIIKVKTDPHFQRGFDFKVFFKSNPRNFHRNSL